MKKSKFLRRLGALLILAGVAAIAGAGFLYQEVGREESEAAAYSNKIMDQLAPVIAARAAEAPQIPGILPEEEDEEYSVVEVDNTRYLGYITFPEFGLSFPVNADWNFESLKRSPVRYSGSLETEDLVIAGHNYAEGFHILHQLSVGGLVTFTDAAGKEHVFRVAAIENLEPDAVREMTAGEWDLTLFTCTFSTQARIAVRCEKEES